MAALVDGSGSFFGGNQHNDVLQASPADAGARARLVEELKRRGNAAFKGGSLPEADTLYSKAIEHEPSKELFTNRSMTRYGMGRFGDSLADAEAALALDAGWVKGHYRKAMAEVGLRRLDAAEATLRKVLQLDPANKAAEQELGKLPKHRADAAAAEAREQERAAQLAKERAERPVARPPAAASAAGAADDGKAKSKDKDKDKGKDADTSMRGYKITADGRKTTFFNRELSEAEKELLKDNKPKALESAEELAERERKLKEEKGVSAWNQGGTFEEKNMSEWARARLKELVLACTSTVSLADAEGDHIGEQVKVSELADFEGDASITFTRGKRRHIFCFDFSAKWALTVGGKKVSGAIFFPDISGDNVQDGERVEAELRWTGREQSCSSANAGLIAKHLMDRKQGLLAAIDKAIFAFAAEFRARD
jgi:tetratricopeptide (TPR) repeat protein